MLWLLMADGWRNKKELKINYQRISLPNKKLYTMKNTIMCQSCGMPLDSDAIKGTEEDGSKSNEYCKYCYENGVFRDPKMNLDDMKNNVKTQMKKLEILDHSIQKAINLLPMLSRWKTK